MNRITQGSLAGSLLMLILGVPTPGRDLPKTVSGVRDIAGQWAPVSDVVLAKLNASGIKPAWPGGTAGVSVDRSNGSVYMIVPDQGVWRSTDKASTFSRADSVSPGSLSGRCETGFALNSDPAGKRLAYFMLDGHSAMMADDGKKWQPFQQLGRGWDFGVVDWSTPDPTTILAMKHESGQELYSSADAGKSWHLLGNGYTAIGIFNSSTFVASTGEGIIRSVDGGVTWRKVSERTPTGRTLCVFKGVGYWVCKEGLLVSKDRGVTWETQGKPIESAWGPFFGKTERQISVVGRVGAESGFWRTDDGGENWKLAAPFPKFEKENAPDWTPSKQWAAGWFTNFGWDPIGDIYYASRMGHPTVKYESGKR